MAARERDGAPLGRDRTESGSRGWYPPYSISDARFVLFPLLSDPSRRPAWSDDNEVQAAVGMGVRDPRSI